MYRHRTLDQARRVVADQGLLEVVDGLEHYEFIFQEKKSSKLVKVVATNRKSKKEDERAEHAAANMAGDRLAEILSKDLDAEDGEHEQRGGNAEGQSRRC